MKKNNFKKRTAIIISLLAVIFVVYFIFFFGREVAAPVSEKLISNSPEPSASSSSLSLSLSTSSSVEVTETDLIETGSGKTVTSSSALATSTRIIPVSPTVLSSASSIHIIPSSPATLSSASSTTISVKIEKQNNINISVPFTPQAPLANWKDERQEDGCEEAVSLMAMAWVNNEKDKTKLTAAVWEKSILALSDFEQEKYGEYRDVSLSDMVTWIFNDYFNYEKVSIKTIASTTDILKELEKGNIVLAPMNGQKLKNPYFVQPGPSTHMILIKGYDYRTKEFITNDPGTRRGENYRYSEEIILGALNVYPTGSHEEIDKIEKAVIVVGK